MSVVDHQLVKRFRQDAGDRISEQRRLDQASGVRPMSAEDERQFARAVIARVLEDHARAEIAAGRTPLDAETEEQTRAAASTPRCSASAGCSRCSTTPRSRTSTSTAATRSSSATPTARGERCEPVAETDEELIELVQVLGAYSGLSLSRPFDSANPQLDLRLPDGSPPLGGDGRVPAARRSRSAGPGSARSSASTCWSATARITPELAGFLAAAVAARKNIMIAGATNAGKTTLLRALANEIPPDERLITVERALELGLGEFEDLHPNVVAFEERLPNSEGQGAIPMAELVRRSLRMNPTRVIVGEVLGDEIVTMLNAMSQGNDGSLSTIHANSSLEVFNRICTYAIQSRERLPIDATMMLIAGAIDFVVFVERRNEYAAAAASAAWSPRCARSTASTGGCSPARSSPRPRTASPSRTRRSSASTSWLAVGYQPDRTWG